MKSNKDIAILYHGSCWDGFGAAWSAWKIFGNRADYYSVRHQEDPPKDLKGKIIYFVDFCYERRVMDQIVKNAKRVVVLDHHISRKTEVKSIEGSIFDNGHSGCVIAWKYFHPSKKIPKMLEYIQDIDLWKFKYKETEEVTAALDVEPVNFKSWDVASKKIENPKSRKLFINKGKAILEYQNLIVKTLASQAQKGKLNGIECMVVNAPHLFASQLGNELVERGSHLALIWIEELGIVHVSLRSDDNVDVSKLSSRYGGGGHKRAAGFEIIKGQPIPWKLIK